jgi:hypothetical protein
MKQLVSKIRGKNFLTAALALGLVFSAEANSVSYTNSVSGTFDFPSTPLALQQFNTSLGTLNSITISLSANSYTSLTVSNSSPSAYGNPSAVWNDVQVLLGNSTFDQAVNSLNPYYGFFTLANAWLDVSSPHFNVSGLASGDTQLFNADNTLPYSSSTVNDITSGTIFSDLQGAGTVDLDVYSVSTVDSGIQYGATFAASETVTGGMTAIVTYDFIPVPEASTVALFSLGGLVLICYRRFTR